MNNVKNTTTATTATNATNTYVEHRNGDAYTINIENGVIVAGKGARTLKGLVRTESRYPSDVERMGQHAPIFKTAYNNPSNRTVGQQLAVAGFHSRDEDDVESFDNEGDLGDPIFAQFYTNDQPLD